MSRIEKPVSVKRHGFWGRLVRGQLFDAGKDAAMLEDDNRYRRLTARADGIRHALKTGGQSAQKRVELENNLRNLELALMGLRAKRGQKVTDD